MTTNVPWYISEDEVYTLKLQTLIAALNHAHSTIPADMLYAALTTWESEHNSYIFQKEATND